MEKFHAYRSGITADGRPIDVFTFTDSAEEAEDFVQDSLDIMGENGGEWIVGVDETHGKEKSWTPLLWYKSDGTAYVLEPDGEAWETVGKVNVDTGSLAIIDPCHADLVSKDFEREVFETHAITDDCDEPHCAGVVIMPTGFGDGSYPVEVRRDEDGRPVEIRISFE